MPLLSADLAEDDFSAGGAGAASSSDMAEFECERYKDPTSDVPMVVATYHFPRASSTITSAAPFTPSQSVFTQT